MLGEDDLSSIWQGKEKRRKADVCVKHSCETLDDLGFGKGLPRH